jgi:hypothetical protein
MGGTERATGITKAELSLKLNQEDVEDAGFMRVKAIVTEGQVIRCLGRDDGAVSHGVHPGLLGRDSKLPTRMASRRWAQSAAASSICSSSY